MKKIMENRGAIDLSIINDLKELDDGDDSIVKQLCEVYFRTAPKQMATIAESLNTDNRNSIQMAAHTIKSSSGNLGAKKLQYSFADLEEYARDGNTFSEMRELFEHIKIEFVKVKDELSKIVEVA